MIALVSDILQLSELDSTQASHSREPVTEMAPVDLAALVKETAQNMTVNARRAYVTLQYDARPATVRGSRDQLSELTQNLCDNAIRYNRPGGHVELRCGVGGDGCPYFEVEDNGIGIPQDSQTRVFERFYRVDKSRSKATGGTGLGLAIVKHIALIHGAQACALLAGRDYIVPEDVQHMAVQVLAHRLVLSPEARMKGVTPESVVRRIVQNTPVPVKL